MRSTHSTGLSIPFSCQYYIVPSAIESRVFVSLVTLPSSCLLLLRERLGSLSHPVGDHLPKLQVWMGQTAIEQHRVDTLLIHAIQYDNATRNLYGEHIANGLLAHRNRDLVHGAHVFLLDGRHQLL
jgi:hypothetical protein